MLFLFAVSPLFLAVIATVSRCYFLGSNAEIRGFPRQRPIFPAVFSWKNSEKQR
jgi:hypothetical protein